MIAAIMRELAASSAILLFLAALGLWAGLMTGAI